MEDATNRNSHPSNVAHQRAQFRFQDALDTGPEGSAFNQWWTRPGLTLRLMSHTADAVIIGGGIAGVSVGYELCQRGLSVQLVEAEPTLAHHSTGRSAAHYLETYGNESVRRLTIAGRPFFDNPPSELVDGPLWRNQPLMHVCSPDHVDRVRALAREYQKLVPTTEFISPAEAVALMSVLRPDVIGGALLEPDAMELDVAAIHQAFVRGMRSHQAQIVTNARVTAIAPSGDGWTVTTSSGVISTALVINAAGAWCDQIAQLASIEPLGLLPLRRTVAVASLPAGIDDAASWPLVAFEAEAGGMAGYCKPEPGGLLISPADETLSLPCDARADEIDVAQAIDVIGQWTTLDLRHVRTTWAGLRTFAADRSLVAGFDAAAPGFFWLAGQGGYGIQTAPGLARAAAGLLLDGELPHDLIAAGLTEAELAPGRPGVSGALAAG